MKTILAIGAILFLVVGVSAQDDTIYVNIGGINGAGESIMVSQDTWIDVPVFFFSGNSEINCKDIVYPLGINNCYFDSIDTENCVWHWPFTYWDTRLFQNWNPDWQTDGQGNTWDSYSFFGVAHIDPPFDSPNLRIFPDDPPLHGLTFRIHSAVDAALTDTSVTDAIGPGYDPQSGEAYMAYPDAGLNFEVCQSFARYLISANHPPDPFEVVIPSDCRMEDFSVDFDIRDAEGDEPEVISTDGEIVLNGYTEDGEARIFHYSLVFALDSLCGECIDEEIIVTATDPNRPDAPVTANAGILSFPGEITARLGQGIFLWPGTEDWMPVYLETCGDCFCLGGFVFTIEYDPEELEPTDAIRGDALSDGEYWSVQYDYEGPGTLRITFINDLNNMTTVPEICALDPEEPIFEIEFWLNPDIEYPPNHHAEVHFMYDGEGEGQHEYNSVSDSSSFKVWINDGCDYPDTSDYSTYQLTMDYGYFQMWGPSPVWGDINENGYPYELGDAILLANHIIDPDAYPFTLRQLFASDVNGDGLQATITDLVYLVAVMVGEN